MFHIEISDHQSCLEVDPRQLEQVARDTLAAEQVASAEISIALLDDAAIHAVNREHLDHDHPTDVISFVYAARRPGNAGIPVAPPRGQGLDIEGEVLISTQTALRTAAEYGWQPQDELTLYLVHGLLHLCGYDDLTEDELRLMRERERAVLKIWNLTPHYRA